MEIKSNITLPIRIGDRPEPQAQNQKQTSARPTNSAQAEVNFVPSDETLLGKIKEALASIKRGTYPDRGSILNLLV